ncbi:MAG: CHASE2 domain-containing protein [Chitinivibrionales bacterium]|nr:CHASE2 domain-containing protein [Chitinivibrionales bacterium]
MNLKRILVLGALTITLLGIVMISPLLGVQDILYSINFMFTPRNASDSVIIVGVDQESIGRIGGWPWPRATLASLFNRVASGDPAVIAPDFLFPHRPDSPGNDSLVSVFSGISDLVLPFRVGKITDDRSDGMPAAPRGIAPHAFLKLSNRENMNRTLFYHAESVDMPDSIFLQHADRTGYLNVSTRKATQRLSEIIHVLKIGNEYFPSFGLAAVASYLSLKPEEFILDGKPQVILGEKKVPLSSHAGSLLLNFRGRSGTIKTVSAADILNGTIAPSVFKGKIVFVGMTDPAAAPDFFITPVGSRFPGVEIWATSALDLLENSWIRRENGPLALLNLALLFILFPGLAILIPHDKKLFSVLISLGAVAFSVGLGVLLFKYAHYFWNPAPHFYAWIFSLLWLALQKTDSGLIEYRTLDFESEDRVAGAKLPPPGDGDFLGEIPSLPTAIFVRDEIGKTIESPDGGKVESTMIESDSGQMPQTAEGNVVTALRELCNGQIVKPLGSGGMADVYLVWNPRLEVYRAVKVLKPDQSPKIKERFETEARILADLNHPNIVQCYSVAEWHGLPCLEMEYINGASMDEILEKCTVLNVPQALAVGIIVCRALEYAHRYSVTIYGKNYNGVIHRDLKPANIMLGKNGSVKLTDFGIARPAEVSLHTVDSNAIVGTLPYLSPEQIEGESITPRSDIYALGVTLYELITGRRALPQTEVTVLLNAKATGKIKPLKPSTILPKELVDIINKSIAVNPDNRYPSAAAMQKDLEKIFRKIMPENSHTVFNDLIKRYRR